MSRNARRLARKAFGASLPEMIRMGKLAKAGARFAERVFERGRRVAITAGIPHATNVYELNFGVSSEREAASFPGDRDPAQVTSGRFETSTCTPVAGSVQDALDDDGPVLVGAIARLTRAILTADDDEVVPLVAERRSLREQLERLRRKATENVVSLDERRPPRRGA